MAGSSCEMYALVRVVLGEVCEQHFAIAGCFAIVHRSAQIGCNEPIQVTVHHILCLARCSSYCIITCQYARYRQIVVR